MKIFEIFVLDPLKKLPGFAAVLAIVTTLWALITDSAESSILQTIIVAGVCWFAFRMSKVMDETVYDCLYSPQREKLFFWKGEDLKKARDKAANAVFRGDYGEAGASGQIYPDKKFYDVAKTLAKNTKQWEDRIARLNDWSKVARTFVALSVAAIVVLLLAMGWADLNATLAPYARRLRFFGTVWAEVIVAIVALCLYLHLRVKHNIELYKYVAEHVVHVQTKDREVPYIFEDILSKDTVVIQAQA
jgi:hypothetical protein